MQSDPATRQGVDTKRGHPRGRLVSGNINFTTAERDSGWAFVSERQFAASPVNHDPSSPYPKPATRR